MQKVIAAFEEMGARAGVSTLSWNSVRGMSARSPVGRFSGFSLDIVHDKNGEKFDLAFWPHDQVEVLDVQLADAHLLLRVISDESASSGTFLCGHDERSWFIAAIPESDNARTVQQGKDALKPTEVWDAMREHGVPMSQRDQRRTAAFVRQGEWFFIPRPQVSFRPDEFLRFEPIRRGNGKPHICQFLYRIGGESVYVNGWHPDGLTFEEYSKLPEDERYNGCWEIMRRNAKVYVRGSVSHPDHATIHLRQWHEVVMNRESEAAAMESVAFLD